MADTLRPRSRRGRKCGPQNACPTVGIALSPTLTTSVFIAIERGARSAPLTEAFAWTSFAAPAGAAAGHALAGLLIGGLGLTTALWQPAIAAGTALTASVLAVRLASSQTPQHA